jgi:hypothetical protein
VVSYEVELKESHKVQRLIMKDTGSIAKNTVPNFKERKIAKI